VTDVGRFFDRQAEAYGKKPGAMVPFHRLTAGRIEAGVGGKVAAIGGLWAMADADRCRELDLTIVDLSPRMLERWSALGYRSVVGDARATPFESASLDHVVFPLVLHHITDGGFRRARREVRRVLVELDRILKPGGRVWISDFSLSTFTYGVEAVAAPITKRLLALAGIPLVVMHPAWFYARELTRAGFVDIDTFRPKPREAPPYVRPIIGLDQLIITRRLYPLTPILISARRRG
jgi:SAM-dependent methyltransferase